MTVVQFPGSRKQQVTRERLDALINELSYLYDSLDRAYQIIHKLEQESDVKEEEYNRLFRTYVEEVGDHEQVEVQYLNYSTRTELIELEDGTLRIKFYDDTPETETPL